jgi:hypothetical protein
MKANVSNCHICFYFINFFLTNKTLGKNELIVRQIVGGIVLGLGTVPISPIRHSPCCPNISPHVASAGACAVA